MDDRFAIRRAAIFAELDKTLESAGENGRIICERPTAVAAQFVQPDSIPAEPKSDPGRHSVPRRTVGDPARVALVPLQFSLRTQQIMNLTKPIVTDVPVLTASECDRVRDAVQGVRADWISRSLEVPFYTLGAASYLDARNYAGYQELLKRQNPMLRENFSWLYERLEAHLSEELGAPASCTTRLALPGFNIFLYSKVFEKPMASVHIDTQYLFHDWTGRDADLANPVSFTVSITLPHTGGGLNTWDICQSEMKARSTEKFGDVLRGRPIAYHAYKRGCMAVHSGHLLHQAAPGRDLAPGDERITVQGHGVLAGGVWELYW